MHTKTRKLMSAAVISAIAGSLAVFSAGCQCHAREQVPAEQKKTVPEAKKSLKAEKAAAKAPAVTEKSAKKNPSKAGWKFTASVNKPDAIYQKDTMYR